VAVLPRRDKHWLINDEQWNVTGDIMPLAYQVKPGIVFQAPRGFNSFVLIYRSAISVQIVLDALCILIPVKFETGLPINSEPLRCVELG
jgi:hypothetical protein